jgi:hypothetical protein
MTALSERPGFYAGIGSRQAGKEEIDRAFAIARALRADGWVLRSGHAPGMDQAFESPAGADAEIYLPWSRFEQEVGIAPGARVYPDPTDEAMAIAQTYHPAWYALRQGGRKLMARNVHQVLGYDCKTPVAFVVCWTPGGQITGGTGQAIRIAMDRQIPVYNIGSQAGVDAMLNTFVIDLPKYSGGLDSLW